MDGLSEMRRRWVRVTCETERVREKVEGGRKKVRQTPAKTRKWFVGATQAKRLNDKALIPLCYEPDRMKHLGGTKYFFLLYDVTESLIICSSRAWQTMQPIARWSLSGTGEGRSAFLLARLSLVCPWPVWTRGQRSDLLAVSYPTETESKQTPPHTEGEGTPLASLPAGPSAPRRWWWRPLSVEMHNVHTLGAASSFKMQRGHGGHRVIIN